MSSSTVEANGIRFDMSALTPGTRFDTEAESRCEVVTTPTPGYDPTPPGNFVAYDSERVLCDFHVSMITWIHA